VRHIKQNWSRRSSPSRQCFNRHGELHSLVISLISTCIFFTQKLTELNLSKLIKDEGTKHLANALENNTVSHILFIDNSRYHLHLFKQTLKKLHLGWDQIEDQAAKDLAAVLKTTVNRILCASLINICTFSHSKSLNSISDTMKSETKEHTILPMLYGKITR
jgi:hypothetical protein